MISVRRPRWRNGALVQPAHRRALQSAGEMAVNLKETIERYIEERPAAMLAGALALGVMLGWLVKRR